MTKITEILHL